MRETIDSNRDVLLALLRGEAANGLMAESWRAGAQLARKLWLDSLLFWRIQTLGLSAQVPPDLLQNLRFEYLRTAQRNARIYHELTLLLKQFACANIPCIPLKGVYLAERVYGNIAARAMSDIDLLVKPGDLARVEDIMHASGYRGPKETDWPPEEREHHGYAHRKNGLAVDVHWNLIHAAHYGIVVDVEALWERSRPASIANQPAREMAIEDQVLYLCVHMTKDFFHGSPLRGLCDLAETLARAETLDWQALVRRAHEWGADASACVSLRLAKELLHSAVPDDALKALTHGETNLRHVAFANEFLFRGQEPGGAAWQYSQDLAKFAANRTLAQRLGLLLQRLFPPRKEMAQIYAIRAESPKVFLYYPVRLVALLFRYGLVVWCLVRGDPQTRDLVRHHRQSDDFQVWLFPGRFAEPRRPAPAIPITSTGESCQWPGWRTGDRDRAREADA